MNFRPSGAARALATMIAASGLLFVHAAQAQSDPNIVIAQNTQAAPAGAATSADGRNADTWLRDGTAFMSASAPTPSTSATTRNTPSTPIWSISASRASTTKCGAGCHAVRSGDFQELVRPAVAVHLSGASSGTSNPGCMPRSRPVCCMATRGKYKTNIPFNDLGVAPAIIPSVGLRYGQLPR